MGVKLEVCVGDPEGLKAAIDGGADRIELCSALEVGGLTPSPGLMVMAARAPVSVYAMIRPRAGNFCFSPADEAAMMADVDAARKFGLSGVVIGASQPDGSFDIALLRRLMMQAQGLGATLHRAFDLVPDPDRALEEAIDLGFERILTSGLQRTAMEGLPMLTRLVERADSRIGIMPGSSITAQNAEHIVKVTGAREIHASCRERIAVTDTRGVDFGFSASQEYRTSIEKVRQLVKVIA